LREKHPEAEEFAGAAAIKGIAAHLVIESWYMNGKPAFDGDVLRTIFEDAWKEAKGEKDLPIRLPHKYNDDEEAYFEEALDDIFVMMNGYVETELAHRLTPIGMEMSWDATVGKYLFEGRVDMIATDNQTGALALVDFKTGKAQMPSEFTFRHGNQFTIYSYAMKHGTFTDRYGEIVNLPGDLPDDIYRVQFDDFKVYSKLTHTNVGPKMAVERVMWAKENGYFDAEKNRLSIPKGARKGPGWYRTERNERDIEYAVQDLARICGQIRMNVFPRKISDQNCTTCPVQRLCEAELNGEAEMLDILEKASQQ
jgi:hypothetical protein